MKTSNGRDKGVNINVSTPAHQAFTDEAINKGKRRGKKMTLRELMDMKAGIL